MARRAVREMPPVDADPELVANAVAKAVAEGDIVGFKAVFSPFSPARDYTAEDFASPKYRFMLVDDHEAQSPAFQAALDCVRQDDVWDHIQGELKEERPPCLPAKPLMLLADNAIALGKYTAASQAYELLRVREGIQDAFFEEADRLLAEDQIERAVKGYDIAASLNYDYAGFPDPLPSVNDFQTRALMLHGEYPRRPQDCVAALPPEPFVRVAIGYLLNDGQAAERLENQPLERRLTFLYCLIHRRDPDWSAFTERFAESCRVIEEFIAAITISKTDDDGRPSLQDEVEVLQAGDPHVIPAKLLGRELPDGEWWQYLKELAVKHPAAPLFVARQLLGEKEILVPRLPSKSPIPAALGLPEEARGVVTGPVEGV
jgi:hypothetical protein